MSRVRRFTLDSPWNFFDAAFNYGRPEKPELPRRKIKKARRRHSLARIYIFAATYPSWLRIVNGTRGSIECVATATRMKTRITGETVFLYI